MDWTCTWYWAVHAMVRALWRHDALTSIRIRQHGGARRPAPLLHLCCGWVASSGGNGARLEGETEEMAIAAEEVLFGGGDFTLPPGATTQSFDGWRLVISDFRDGRGQCQPLHPVHLCLLRGAVWLHEYIDRAEPVIKHPLAPCDALMLLPHLLTRGDHLAEQAMIWSLLPGRHPLDLSQLAQGADRWNEDWDIMLIHSHRMAELRLELWREAEEYSYHDRFQRL